MTTNAKTGDHYLRALDGFRFDSDAGEGLTVREYFRELLATLWSEGECFSGKRPFGNSSWDYELYSALIANGCIGGALDENGYLDSVEEGAAEFVAELIRIALTSEPAA